LKNDPNLQANDGGSVFTTRDTPILGPDLDIQGVFQDRTHRAEPVWQHFGRRQFPHRKKVDRVEKVQAPVAIHRSDRLLAA
jgi:hypothetical protein